MGVLAVIAMLMMYLFAAKQVTDTETPRIAGFVQDVLQRNLAETPRTLLTQRARSAEGARRYELVLHPAPRIAGDAAAVEQLLEGAAKIVFEELERRAGDATVTCVAVLPEGERRVTYDSRMQRVPEPGSTPPGDTSR